MNVSQLYSKMLLTRLENYEFIGMLLVIIVFEAIGPLPIELDYALLLLGLAIFLIALYLELKLRSAIEKMNQ